MKTYEITLNGRQYGMLEKLLYSNRARRLAMNQKINGYDLFCDIVDHMNSLAEDSGCDYREIFNTSLNDPGREIDLLRHITKAVYPEDRDFFVRQIGKKFTCGKDFNLQINLKI